MEHMHETATLAWLRAEGIGTTVVLVEQHRGRIRPATDLDSAKITVLSAVNAVPDSKLYDVTSSAGDMGTMGGGTVFTLATPAEAEAWHKAASALGA